MVLHAGDTRGALETLCRTYRPPVLDYIRHRGYPADSVEDLAQAFFAQFIEHAWHANADPARGRFRAFLLTALKRFLIDTDERLHAKKRGGAMQFRSFDQTATNPSTLDNLAGDQTPDLAFERSWAATLLATAMRRLRTEAEEAGKLAMFDQLREFLGERPDEADYARVAQVLNLRRNTLAVAVHRLRHRLRELIRDELAQTTTSKAELEAEIQALRHSLGRIL
ncbi:MAG: sigma-70 family RNA polymerase sigma factor [Proteobacteria bacterium]|nr:sigma-70 family RNA polymerase sigma factor [Pseudomonadota bacterium]